LANLKDVAKLAGVSLSTASYALNGVNKVSPETQRKILEAAKTLNYQKNGIASDLKKTKTNTIALILSDLSGPYYSELIKGVQEVSIENEYNLIACSSLGGPNSTAIKFLKEKRADGVIILAHNIPDNIVLEYAREGFPIVVLERTLKHDHTLSVEVNNINGGLIATEHLIENGHQDIAFVSGPVNSDSNNKRFEGYQLALEKNGIAYNPGRVVLGNFTRKGGYSATKELIEAGNLPSAIFYANDEMALGGLQAFMENEIKIPDDISIIGFDDIFQDQFLFFPLTTIRQPKYEAGLLAGNLLFKVFKGEVVERYFNLSTQLIERGSVKKIK
jgi:LacI family transcriptional regulator